MEENTNNIFAGTFLGSLADIMAKGEFIDVEDQPAEGEEIIGEMTSLERAFYALKHRMLEEVAKICEPCQCTEQEHASAECAKAKKIKVQLEVLRPLFWRLIEERLNFDGNLGVRHGFKIVKLPPSSPRTGIIVVESTIRGPF